MKHLLIRADATTGTGTGHIMRCIALAQAWRDRGGQVTFLSHCESDAFRKRIASEGFGFVSVERPHPDPCDLKKTLGLLQRIGSGGVPPWLVLDGYHFDPSYQEAVHQKGFRLLVIDDYNHQPHYHADILLNQNIVAERFQYSCGSDTVLLLGTKYALLRNEFLGQRKKMREQPLIARKLLVTLGGADPENVTLTVVRALKRVDVRGLEVKIVVGPSNPYWKTLEKEVQTARATGGAFQVIRNGRMPGLMGWAEMAVSAGGSTCWELAYMGVPFFVVIVSENQEKIAEGLAKAGVAINCGWFHDLTEEKLLQDVLVLVGERKIREELSQKGQQLVDGHGAERVLSKMMSR